MMGSTMWGPWILILCLALLVFGPMRHRCWSAVGRRRGEQSHLRGAAEREDLRPLGDLDQLEELEDRVAELESGLEFAERLLVSRGESQELPRRVSTR